MPALLWLWILSGPALLGLFARRLWVSVLLIVLNAAAVWLHMREPDLGVMAILALYPIAVVLVVMGRRSARPVDPNVERVLAELKELNHHRSDWC